MFTALLITMMTLRRPITDALYLAIKERGQGSETPSMIPPAMKNLYPRHPTIGEIETNLQRLIDAASVAKIPDNAKKHKGPDRKLDVFEIAKSDFHSLTGESPTAGQRVKKNGFRDFLTAIFEALNMPHHSAESFAKRARNWWENDRSREDYAELRKLVSRVVRVVEE